MAANNIYVLGLETSCDETAAAIVEMPLHKGRVNGAGRILANQILSQIDTHAPYGGVVPELAARAHLSHLDRLIAAAFAEADCGLDDMDAIAATAGPGLIGGVLIGLTTGKALALAAQKPFIGINHLEGHALSARLTEPVEFPYLLLLVSGGHCQLLAVNGLDDYALLGQTLDDAVGEAFDKTAKLLGLGYPGGPALAALAEGGNEAAFDFPRPMLNKPNFDFSFSGLKTAVMLEVRKAEAEGRIDACRADLAASFQRAAVDTLIGKSIRAARSEGFDRIIVAGGVGANKLLRREIAERFEGEVYYPRLAFCTDNGAMIAVAGALRVAEAGQAAEICARARWSLDSLSVPVRAGN